MPKHWLATFEWRRLTATAEWRRENVLVTGDIGVWWANYMTEVEEMEAVARAKAKEYEAAGKRVPLFDDPKHVLADYRFLYATPITDEGWEALHELIDVKKV